MGENMSQGFPDESANGQHEKFAGAGETHDEQATPLDESEELLDEVVDETIRALADEKSAENLMAFLQQDKSKQELDLPVVLRLVEFILHDRFGQLQFPKEVQQHIAQALFDNDSTRQRIIELRGSITAN